MTWGCWNMKSGWSQTGLLSLCSFCVCFLATQAKELCPQRRLRNEGQGLWNQTSLPYVLSPPTSEIISLSMMLPTKMPIQSSFQLLLDMAAWMYAWFLIQYMVCNGYPCLNMSFSDTLQILPKLELVLSTVGFPRPI